MYVIKELVKDILIAVEDEKWAAGRIEELEKEVGGN